MQGKNATPVSWTFLALLTLPLLIASLPALTVPVSDTVARTLVPAVRVEPTPARAPMTPAHETISPSPTVEAPRTPSTFRRFISTKPILLGLWCAGTLMALLALTISVLRVYWLSRSAIVTELKVDDKVRGFEREIKNLDADRRLAEIERRIEAERPRLKAAIAAAR